METIIGLLFILLPVIFKLISRNLEKSGNPDTARKVRDIAQTLGGEEEPVLSDWDFGHIRMEEPEPEPEPVMPVAQKLDIPVREGTPVTVRKPILEEEKPVKKGEKIDPKKLVIYSELMKPKF